MGEEQIKLLRWNKFSLCIPIQDLSSTQRSTEQQHNYGLEQKAAGNNHKVKKAVKWIDGTCIVVHIQSVISIC